MRTLLIITGICSLYGQQAFTAPITNADGSILAFTVSEGLQVKSKAAAWVAAGTTLVPVSGFSVGISADGRRIATRKVSSKLGSRPGCNGGSSCITTVFVTNHWVADISNPAAPRTLFATEILRSSSSNLSADGRYFLWESGQGFTITDLDSYQAQQSTQLLVNQFGRMQWLSDGRLFVFASPAWGFLSLRGEFTPISTPVKVVGTPVISSDGRRVFYFADNSDPMRRSLRKRELRFGSETEFEDTAAASGNPVVISHTGEVALFAKKTNGIGLRLFAATARGILPLLEDEPVTSYALSDNGKNAFCVTVRGRIVRINIDAILLASSFWPSEPTELVPRTPMLVPGVWVPGSQIQIHGTGLADRAYTVADGEPWTEELDGIRVTNGEQSLALGHVSPTLIRAQIPFEWESLVGQYLPALQIRAESPFEWPSPSPEKFGVQPFHAAGLPGGIEASVVYRDADLGPAKPGELLHFFLTGLGPVSPPMATGIPTPDPAPVTVVKFTCKIMPGANPVAVEFVGLETGMVGVYRATIRLPPDDLPKSFAYVRCESQNPVVGFDLRLP